MVEELMCSREQPDYYSREALFLQLLQEPFELLEIAGDGNCIFLSTHIALLAAEAIEAGSTLQEACEALRTSMVDYGESFRNAEVMRRGALQMMFERADEYYPDVLQLLSLALSSADMDPTTTKIQELLKGATPPESPGPKKTGGMNFFNNCPPKSPTKAHIHQCLSAMTRNEVLELYCKVMSEPGIYGERLEWKALAQYCHRPIHLYYLTGWEQMLQCAAQFTCEPSESFGEDQPGKPLAIYHSIGGKHFHVLVNRPESELPSSWECQMTEEEELQYVLQMSNLNQLPGTPSRPPPTQPNPTTPRSGVTNLKLAKQGSTPKAWSPAKLNLERSLERSFDGPCNPLLASLDAKNEQIVVTGESPIEETRSSVKPEDVQDGAKKDGKSGSGSLPGLEVNVNGGEEMHWSEKYLERTEKDGNLSAGSAPEVV
eukprot:CAMPEP_0197861210 /NCGR_PEP_ID=MMETSP1438-20131217/37110_1 /TAXON_ID=1461541 /ORGANISM="Pterosperma sp., Strain CCMP1384" /LENGTH=429 /DNA_ID=CAMNT_0043478311 /DNA_START=23 /DNA_END=1312 /DNA_ORIENTATION=-